jgi:two-component system cell cycle response regulator
MKPKRDMTQSRLLLIDDDPAIHDLVEFHLEGVVDEVLHAQHPTAGLVKAAQERPDVILLDVNMPYMDGFQVCRQLKESDVTRDIPVVFLTVDDSVYYIAKALDIGGADYVTKPFQAVELQARVRAALRVRRLIEMLRTHARVDALTGLKNRGALDEALAQAAAGFRRDGRPYAVVILDIDHFKQINDTYGHGVGDEALRRLGAVVSAHCRPTDVVGRYGGEEFVLLLHNVHEADATTTTERLLQSVRETEVSVSDARFNFTCSAGLAMVDAQLPAEDAVERADAALYRAKDEGRDRLVLWSGMRERVPED